MGRIRLAFSRRYLTNGTWRTQTTPGDVKERIRYNADLLETIEFGGDDCEFTINLNVGRVYDHWAVESYPSPEVRNKVLAVMYFAHKAMELDGLSEEIACSLPVDRRTLRNLGEQAITIIDGIRPPAGPVRPKNGPISSLKTTLRQTLHQDMDALTRLPAKMTELQWFMFKVNRQRLVSNLEQASAWLRHLDVVS